MCFNFINQYLTWKEICILLEAREWVPVVQNNVFWLTLIAVVAAGDDCHSIVVIKVSYCGGCFQERDGEIEGVGRVVEGVVAKQLPGQRWLTNAYHSNLR